MIYPVHVSDKKCIDFLLIAGESKTHYVYINDFNRFMCNKTKNNKKPFCRYCLQCLSTEKVRTMVKINGKQSVKLRNGSIKSKNFFKQLAIPFKLYSDFESVLKEVKSNDKSNNASCTKIYQEHVPCNFAYKVVCN